MVKARTAGWMSKMLGTRQYESQIEGVIDGDLLRNADALIAEYWKKHPKKARKSMEAKTPAKKPHKSAAPEEVPETTTKKRGRKSQTGPESSARAGSEVADARAAKKAKKNGAAKAETEEATRPSVVEDDAEAHFTDMSKYMAVQDWDHLVQTIDTIERNADDTLHVYFSL